MDNAEMFEQLRAPFPPDRISWRVGPTTKDKAKGMALGYIDARDVADRLDEVCTPAGWANRYPHANGKTVCAIGILCEVAGSQEWVWKEDGAGDTDMEATKGALSDAFKRAAVRWGIGRYLYDLKSPWVEIEPQGNSYVIKASELAKLVRTLSADAEEVIPPAPPPKPIAAPNNEALASALILQLRKNKTTRDLRRWGEDKNIKSQIGGLDEASAHRVRTDFGQRLRMLSTENGAHP